MVELYNYDGSADDDDDDELPALAHNQQSSKTENVEIVDLSGEEMAVSLEDLKEIPLFNPRAYQLEMLDESLKRNIIVAMDTGSGKTQVAVLRIQKELERIPTDQIIWFLATTVALCEQQHAVLSSQIPSVLVKILCGADNVDKWTDIALWDAVLKNVRIVVSTHMILYDALCHGFVQMGSLALLVFDEAHNCVKSHPGSKIMRDYYQQRLAANLPVPHILGLSASPIMNSKLQSLEKIEWTLNSICRTPIKHREELLCNVNLPVLERVLFVDSLSADNPAEYTASMTSLHNVYYSLSIIEDPWVVSLLVQDSENSRRAWVRAIESKKTWCQKQMNTLCTTSQVVFRELGSWAADYYIAQSIWSFIASVDCNSLYFETATSEERRYLSGILRQVEITFTPNQEPATMQVSDKVTQLITALFLSEANTKGIVFAERRVIVAVLSRLLSLHPLTRGRLRVGSIVGASQHAKRKDIGNLIEQDDVPSAPAADFYAKSTGTSGKQNQTLDMFREGKLDLVIATSVLEEGIDIPACNAVICFNPPKNLKSLIQRRGRARMRKSRLVLMQAHAELERIAEWQLLEAEMRTKYADDMRQLKELETMEDEEEHDGRELRIAKTGALLNLDNAIAHLYHFCSMLPNDPYIDAQPVFILSPEQPAKVLLPLSVDLSVRTAEAQIIWKSERNAKKDAAFTAYVALYNAGLVNDNLLPLLKHDPEEDQFATAIEKRQAMVKVEAQINPWVEVCQAWTTQSESVFVVTRRLTVRGPDQCIIWAMDMILPSMSIPEIPPISLFWDHSTTLAITSDRVAVNNQIEGDQLQLSRNETKRIFEAAYGWRFAIQRSDFAAVFTSCDAFREPTLQCSGYQSATERLPSLMQKDSFLGMVRQASEIHIPYIFEQVLNHKPSLSLIKSAVKDYGEIAEDTPHLILSKLPRRVDFLHRLSDANQVPSKKPYSYAIPMSRCSVDNLPFKHVQFTLMIPSFLRRLEIHMVADKLINTLLKGVEIQHATAVTAICASSANEQTNYQRLEFLGDSLLKMCTSIHLLAEYPLWHEGYLSFKKDRIVANSRLARAALDAGLQRFIITEPFAGSKWRPLYVQDVLSMAAGEPCKREISTKVLADVVEALVGASYVDGGISSVLACLGVFLKEVDWEPLDQCRATVFARTPPNTTLPLPLVPLERLIGYEFTKKTLLIESMTHASYNIGTASLERLEFLGDAILDNIIVDAIFRHEVELSHVQMHRLRTALVNADFLAFMCMEWVIEIDNFNVVGDQQGTPKAFQIQHAAISLPLWRFMRHASAKISKVQQETLARHLALREEISLAIATGSHYPWALLNRIQSKKFYSDLVESLLGAVYIDSGTLEPCKAILNKMGILPYLTRILRDEVHILHPKEELGILADADTVRYECGLQKDNIGDMNSMSYTCEVFVGDISIATVRHGVSKEEIMTKAAETAVRVLKQDLTTRSVGVFDRTSVAASAMDIT